MVASDSAIVRPDTNGFGWDQVLIPAALSLGLVSVAIVWGCATGLGLALLRFAIGHRTAFLGVIATAVWITPTFLLAAFAQEIQAQIYGATGLSVTGGDGTGSAIQAAWAGAILGLRPAAYIYRHSQVAIGDQLRSDHVRTARAKGVRATGILLRHALAPALPTILAGLSGSLRLMIGALPLIEYFFAYPGLGWHLILSVGISYPDQIRTFDPNLALVLIVILSGFLVATEEIIRLVQAQIDPRLREARVRAPA